MLARAGRARGRRRRRAAALAGRGPSSRTGRCRARRRRRGGRARNRRRRARVTEAITPTSPRRRGTGSARRPRRRAAGRAGSIGELARDARDDLRGGDDVVGPPAVVVADIHVLDEAHDVSRARGSSGPGRTTACSLTPRCTTMLSLTAEAGVGAASMPSQHALHGIGDVGIAGTSWGRARPG